MIGSVCNGVGCDLLSRSGMSVLAVMIGSVCNGVRCDLLSRSCISVLAVMIGSVCNGVRCDWFFMRACPSCPSVFAGLIADLQQSKAEMAHQIVRMKVQCHRLSLSAWAVYVCMRACVRCIYVCMC
jgi:hypothetical protein